MAEERIEGMERRMVHRLLMHWRAVRGDEGIPSLEAVFQQPCDGCEPFIYVLGVGDVGEEPEFERIGEFFADELPSDLIGKPVSAVPEGTLLERAVRYYGDILKKKVPMTLGGEFVHARGDTILYRSIILPLSGGEGVIGHLMGAANCKAKEGDA